MRTATGIGDDRALVIGNRRMIFVVNSVARLMVAVARTGLVVTAGILTNLGRMIVVATGAVVWATVDTTISTVVADT